jgi:hypothetical protein
MSDSSSFDARISDYFLTATGHLDSKGASAVRQLVVYGSAAGSALAMMSQAEAAIVHNAGTARPVTAVSNGGTNALFTTYPGFNIDGDATSDFWLFGKFSWNPGSGTQHGRFGLNATTAAPAVSNSVLGVGTHGIRKLASGASIGPANTSWRTAQSTNRRVFSTSSGSHFTDVSAAGWAAPNAVGSHTHTGTGLVGVRFKKGADTYYGWIRLQLHETQGLRTPPTAAGDDIVWELRATEWAYEACPGQPITAGTGTGGVASCPIAPAPAPVAVPVASAAAYGLLSLALGAAGGLAERRRRRKPDESAH